MPTQPPSSNSSVGSSAPPSLLTFSYSASPTCNLDVPSVFRSPALSHIEDHLPLPPVLVSPAPPQPIDTSAPPESVSLYAFSGLSCPSGYTLVSYRPFCTFSSVWLCLHPGSAYFLCPTGSASALRASISTSDVHDLGTSSVSWTIEGSSAQLGFSFMDWHLHWSSQG